MHIQRYQDTQPARYVVLFISIGCLLLAGLLAGCGQTTPVQTHTFAGKLNQLNVPAPYNLPGKIVPGPDGNLWFPAVAYANFTTDKPSGAIGQLTPAGKFHFFPLTTLNTYPLDIAFGRDGTLWFSAFVGNGKLAPIGDVAPHFTGGTCELGRMSLDGHFHLFTLPRPAVSLPSIAVGADGDLWFTEVSQAGAPASAYVNTIGRVTPSSVFSEFPLTLRKSGDFVNLLIAGPDGNLWFSIESYLSDYSAFGEMGRMSPQGAVTIYTLGKFVEPRDLTIGPDGNIWFSTSIEVGRITTSGQLRLYDPDPKAQSFQRILISGVTTNSDGALWFATDNVAVGRVTPNGTFKFYPFPAGTSFDNGGSSLDMGNLRGIAAGTDGTLWLTNDGQIGHFV